MASSDYFVSCSKLTPTVTTNSQGKPYETYETSTIYGYLGKRTEKEVKSGDKTTIETYFNFLSSDLTLKYNDRILYETKYYKVISEPVNTAHKNDHVKCKVKMITNVRQ